ncbi:MAG: polysaccharide biosynthesis C-terminal domain-containing protein, partial [Gammaproteobacteria bacterium]|nr:polysaccharide biosynthesis C-terminal domain-containing protein [Gammaproteobacteria bacterium]
LYRSLFGLTLNLGLNFLLIPRYSVLGAAVSTLLAQVLSSYVSNLWLGGGERVFQTQTRLILFFQWKRRYRL